MKQRAHYGGFNSHEGPAPLCPGCEGTTILRSDTGQCERCTAKMPAFRRAWQETRRKAIYVKPPPPSVEPYCLRCNGLHGGLTEEQHRVECVPLRYRCAYCHLRFHEHHQVRAHERRVHAAS